MHGSSSGATLKRRLSAGRSIWQSRRLPVPLPSQSRIVREIACDVLVVGAGISGALVADALSDAGLDVIVVDRRQALQGSTPASTALLQYEIDTPLSLLARRIGKDRAQRIWRRSRLALDALRERARRLGVQADLENRDSLYLEGDVLDSDALAEEAGHRRACGFEVAFMTRPVIAERYGIAGRAGVLGFDNLSADPRRLAAGFLHAAIDRGAKLYEGIEIADIEASKSGVAATSVEGAQIRAAMLVFATGYELPKGVPRKNHSIRSTWALATYPQPRSMWRDRCFIWEASEPYLYLRAGPGGRVICGGEDEDFADEEKRDALMDAKIARIQRKLKALMPSLDVEAEFRWCGNFGASTTGTPSIGRVPGMPNCYAVLGYGGNGITFSMLAAQLLRTEITGGRDPDGDLFSFNRSF
jgi:glycine/D-amino acid oxidase-like deaminating enzyme